MAKSWRNPFAFTALPVTIIASIIYATLFISLIVVHHIVPAAPKNPVPFAGINTTEAWLDLKHLTNGYHPYNSRRNDVVRNWLLVRLDQILQANNISYVTETGTGLSNEAIADAPVVIFNDLHSNLSFHNGAVSTYFEGTNIIVYIRGEQDGPDDWHSGPESRGGVLVNAHYDSVSTGYGATDDGVGVVSVLQLVKYFTYPGNQPKRGLVALLNNGEEDFLNGASVFSQHPISSFPHTFLNLEGAAAGGKAALFRSTDTEVTRSYKGTSYPFGTAVSGDAFKRGVIRSQTDYIVFNGQLGMRGLDVAFFESRARYHTDQDDTKHTSVDSLWHMLSAALHTVDGLTSDTSSTFEGDSTGKGKVHSGSGSDAVWFDMFGESFVIFDLHTLFALSVTLLVVSPIFVIATIALLSKLDRFYMFSISTRAHDPSGDLRVSLGGFKGFFRFPIIFAVSSAAVIGTAFLLTKLNPMIVYSSPYSVWSMMISVWIFLFWFFSRSIDFVRPSAFQRGYAILWLFLGGWVLLVIETVYEERLGLAAGYPWIFYFAAISLATLIALSEQFGLETKEAYAEKHAGGFEEVSPANVTSGEEEHGDDEQATESTSLLRGSKRTTFANYSSGRDDGSETQATGIDEDDNDDDNDDEYPHVYKHEQLWSERLPSWTWILQLLILAPVPVVILGQIGLYIVTATQHTLADGNPPFSVYISMAILTILILTPLGPFLHRYTHHIPIFLLAVLVGTLVYNIVAFPFSGNNRLKVYFVQRVDLDSGLNTVTLIGIGSPYMDDIVQTLPSAAGQRIHTGLGGLRKDLTEYNWTGIPPNVVKNALPGVPAQIGYKTWLQYNITRDSKTKSANIVLFGKNTRSCRLLFNNPINSYVVEGSTTDNRFPAISEDGTKEIRLWSREWEVPWNVTFSWEGSKGVDGKVVCLWNDEDGQGLIPALEEIRRFAPDWTAVTKASDGLVEGFKAFTV
jgi:hypothetical protein